MKEKINLEKIRLCWAIKMSLVFVLMQYISERQKKQLQGIINILKEELLLINLLALPTDTHRQTDKQPISLIY